MIALKFLLMPILKLEARLMLYSTDVREKKNRHLVAMGTTPARAWVDGQPVYRQHGGG